MGKLSKDTCSGTMEIQRDLQTLHVKWHGERRVLHCSKLQGIGITDCIGAWPWDAELFETF